MASEVNAKTGHKGRVQFSCDSLVAFCKKTSKKDRTGLLAYFYMYNGKGFSVACVLSNHVVLSSCYLAVLRTKSRAFIGKACDRYGQYREASSRFLTFHWCFNILRTSN